MHLDNRGCAAVVVGLCLLSGCSGVTPESATIARADRITWYEGLPDPVEERTAFDAESKSKPTVEMHGFRFYREALRLDVADAEKLEALLKNPKTFEPFSGEKKCGGFHPDYAVEWSIGDKTYSCLICFGCFEVKIYGPATEARYDLQGDARKLLKDTPPALPNQSATLPTFRDRWPPQNP